MTNIITRHHILHVFIRPNKRTPNLLQHYTKYDAKKLVLFLTKNIATSITKSKLAMTLLFIKTMQSSSNFFLIFFSFS